MAKQTAQEKLCEQFEESAKRAEELARHARGLTAMIKASENNVLSKENLEDWRGAAVTVARNVKLFEAWLEIDIIETDQFLAQKLKNQTNRLSQKT